MRIFGLDFTSSPARRKPITCPVCEQQGRLLRVQEILIFTSFDGFEDFLRSEGPWLAALDFPFGQPRKLLANLNWPEIWEEYMSIIASMDKKQFEESLPFCLKVLS